MYRFSPQFVRNVCELLVILVLFSLWPAETKVVVASPLPQPASIPIPPSDTLIDSVLASAMAADASRKIIVERKELLTLAELAKNGATLLVDYSEFSLWKVSESQNKNLLTRGKSLVAADELNIIELRDSRINTVSGATEVPTALRQNKTNGFQFWLIQFVGPIKAEWLDKLRKAGIEIVSYMPNNAYVVWVDGARLTQLENLVNTDRTVQWTGPYHPAYRLSPTLQPGRNRPTRQANELVTVTVQFYKTPDTAASLTRLQALGGKVFLAPSQVLNFVNISLELPAGQLTTVAAWADVFNVEPWEAPRPRDEAQGQIIAGNITTSGGNVVPTGPGYLAWLASKGFPTDPTSYPLVDVVDDGIDNGSATPLHADFYEQGTTTNPDRLIFNGNCTTDPSGNGVGGHGNINAGIVGGYNNRSGTPYADANGYHLGLGISPYGRVAGTKIFGNSGFNISACGGNIPGLVQAAYNGGATMTSNSWGADVGGAYTSDAQAYDALTRDASGLTNGNQQMLHIFSAGNAGPGTQSIGTPGTAKNVLTVGATENVRDDGILDGCRSAASNNADDLADFSSRGPTTDLRNKPDIVAPGIHIQGPASQDPAYSGTGVCGASTNPPGKYYPAGQTLYTWSSGTSHSAPAVAGAASLVYNYYNRVLKPGQNPSPAMLKALMLNSPRYLNGLDTGGTLPSSNQGWGDVNLGTLFDGTPRFLLDQSQTFDATGQAYQKAGTVTDSGKPFRVTLVWTDAPGSTTGNSYVNDLNLEVNIGGQVFKGNVFNGANSISGSAFDARNNVESVFIPAGVSGPFSVKVTAANLAGDGVPDNLSLTDQDFALVIYNGSIVPSSFLNPVAITTSDASGNNNGIVEPGETISMTIALTNVGDLIATNLNSTLTVGSGATIINGASPYADIAPNAIISNTLSYTFTISSNLPCGSLLNFTQNVSYNSGATFTYQFELPTGIVYNGSGVTYVSSDVPRAIPDFPNPGINSLLPINVSDKIGKIKVKLNITHTWDADMVMKLISPKGTIITLANSVGINGDNFVETVFDDAAPTSITSGTAPFTGSYRPQQPLALFNSEAISGSWKLNLSDNATLDTGTLNSWSIEIQPQFYNCAPTTPGFSSNPVPNSTLALGNSPVGVPVSATLTIAETGFNDLIVSDPLIEGPQAAEFAVSAPGGFPLTLPDGGPTKTVSISCIPAYASNRVATLKFNTNDPAKATVSYNLSCSGILAVTQSGDNGLGDTPASLSYLLKLPNISGQTIGFALINNGTRVTVSGPLPPVPPGVTIDGGCSPNGPRITLDGANLTGDGLTLGSNNVIIGLKIIGFGGKQLYIPNGSHNNVLKCVVTTRNSS